MYKIRLCMAQAIFFLHECMCVCAFSVHVFVCDEHMCVCVCSVHVLCGVHGNICVCCRVWRPEIDNRYCL